MLYGLSREPLLDLVTNSIEELIHLTETALDHGPYLAKVHGATRRPPILGSRAGPLSSRHPQCRIVPCNLLHAPHWLGGTPFF